RRKRKASDFSSEMEAHIQLETDRLREQGVSEREARAAARRAFGNVTQAQERFYESGRWLFWDDLGQDLRFAFRMLHKSPGLATYQMTRVGLGTGNNSTRAWLYEVSGNYFDVLKLQPYLGGFFHSSDELGAGSAPYIVLSYAYWHGHFQDDPGVVGRRAEVN